MSCLLPIPGHAGYFITETGRVFTSRRRWTGGALTELAQSSSGAGYRKVNLHERRKLVHRLVLHAFRGPPPPGMECRHLDGDKRNNDVANLEWATRAVNMADNVRHGVSLPGERNPRAKLSDAEADAIRASTEKQQVIAAKYGVSQTLVSMIRTGKVRPARKEPTR